MWDWWGCPVDTSTLSRPFSRKINALCCEMGHSFRHVYKPVTDELRCKCTLEIVKNFASQYLQQASERLATFRQTHRQASCRTWQNYSFNSTQATDTFQKAFTSTAEQRKVRSMIMSKVSQLTIIITQILTTFESMHQRESSQCFDGGAR